MLTLETYNINKMVVKAFMLLVFLVSAGCSYLPHIMYKIDVQQGNVVTEEMLEKLKPGMTKSQVLFVMGSPLIVDAFRDNRWDYVYVLREKGELVEQKRLTIYFNDDKLVNIENIQSFSRDPIKSSPAPVNPEPEKIRSDAAEAK
jgi:outer membrane protein assembly factor BamE